MKIYHYDHCPYCVKARMILGFKNVPHEEQILANDDEATPIGLIGQKMLPILVQEGHSPLPESLDIIDYVDHLAEYGTPIVKKGRNNPFLNQWLTEARGYHYFLAMPRWLTAGLPEFAEQSAVDYFTKKKTAFVGSFEEKLRDSEKYKKMAVDHLIQLESSDLRLGAGYMWGELSYDDFHLFAALRCLTVVNGLEFPPGIEAYTQFLSEKSKVPLHWNVAQ